MGWDGGNRIAAAEDSQPRSSYPTQQTAAGDALTGSRHRHGRCWLSQLCLSNVQYILQDRSLGPDRVACHAPGLSRLLISMLLLDLPDQHGLIERPKLKVPQSGCPAIGLVAMLMSDAGMADHVFLTLK